MGKVEVLDCTLRDGGRIINCDFGENSIKRIISGLSKAGIDIIEIGFLRSGISYTHGTTFFTDIKQVNSFLPEQTSAQYVMFTDFGMFDYSILPDASETRIDGIRFGFKYGELKNALPSMLLVKEKGYKLFVQSVNSLSYSETELREMVNLINTIRPTSFAIVDTYGAMYDEDLESIYNIIVEELDRTIAIDFHSHNNYQLSFSLAQKIINLSEQNNHDLIIDATLLGMGKGAGNLSTELLVEYLNRKKKKEYDFNLILDITDEEVAKYKKNYEWGYSVPTLMSGVYKAHPNNVIYLTNKFKLSTKDIINILSKLDEKTRLSYNYGAIEKAYLDYFCGQSDAKSDILKLQDIFSNRNILVIAPGKNIGKYKKELNVYIYQKNPIIITVNFESVEMDHTFVFWNSQKRYKQFQKRNGTTSVIITSNIKQRIGEEYVVPYSKLIEYNCKHFENSTMMVLRMLKSMKIKSLALAGMDGFSGKMEDNYISEAQFDNARMLQQYEEINQDIALMMTSYLNDVQVDFPIRFITPSIFENYCFPNQNKEICLLALDVDGTMTDGSINIGENGEIFKRFNVADGYGITKVIESGVEVIILTGRESKIVKNRALELGIHNVFQNIKDKEKIMQKVLSDRGIGWENVAYMGDDDNDLSCIIKAGLSACPSNSSESISSKATYLCKAAGGNGAVREFCDILLNKLSGVDSKS